MILLSQIQEGTQQLVNLTKIGGVVFVAKSVFDLYTNWREGRDRKRHTEEFIEQTVHLKDIKTILTKQIEQQLKDTQAIALATQRQSDMKTTLDRVDKNVLVLKVSAGFTDDTTIIHKEHHNANPE